MSVAPTRLLLAVGSPEEESALQAALNDGAFASCGATTLEEVDQALADGDIDLVIAGRLADELTLLDRIREQSPNVPIVLVCPPLDEESTKKAIERGMGEWVDWRKLDDLGEVVQRLVELSTSRQRALHAEEELEAQGERYRRLFESTPVALWEIDAREAWAILIARDTEGADLDEALAEAAKHVVVLKANDEARSVDLGSEVERIWIALLEAYVTGQHDLRLEHRFEAGLEGLITARLPKKTDDLDHVVVALLDVTQQHQLRQAFLAAQRMEAVGQLASGIAHDFNNILMVVGTYAEFLRESIGSDKQATEDLEVIVDGVQRATALVGQLLAFTRRQAQKLERLDLNAIVAKTERMLRRVLGEDIDLGTELAKDVELIRADPAQLDQILMNLVVNARDAMPSGGKLTLRTRREVRTHPETRAPGFTIEAGSYAVLSVADTGVGMPREVAERIFEPFYTTKADRGSGLGLSTVYGIVKQSGGYITLDSRIGEGTTFEVYLPVAESQGTPVEGIPRDAIPRAADGTVLLVEDNADVRRAARRMLEERGYTVLDAGDPEAALTVARDHDDVIHVLVTDVVLPGMNGVELQERVRKLRPDIGVVFTSGYTDHGALRQALESRDAIFVQKPTGAEELDRAISRVRFRS